jgi:hypothetical protein
VKVCLALFIVELKKKMAQEELELGRLLTPKEREEKLALIKKNVRDSEETERATGALRKCPGPKCRAPYMKIAGCEHMKCGRCKKKLFNDTRPKDELEVFRLGSYSMQGIQE